MAKKPPHVLVTTPESFFILLTSESGRRGLKNVSTLIVDELHAVADDKRGSHLSISMERLVQLSDEPITRIGLSATQNPIEEIGRFLVGTDKFRFQRGNPTAPSSTRATPARSTRNRDAEAGRARPHSLA